MVDQLNLNEQIETLRQYAILSVAEPHPTRNDAHQSTCYIKHWLNYISWLLNINQ